MKSHRTGIHEGFLTRHRLSLVGLTRENADAIQSRLDGMIGVAGVWLDIRRGTLKIAYDASHHDIDEILGIIRENQADISRSWWQHFKLGWIRQIDQNIKDNAAHEPHCCNKMPTNVRGPDK